MKVLNVYELTMKDVYDGLLNGVADRLNSRGVLNDLHKWGEKSHPSAVKAIGIPIGGNNLYLSKGVTLRIVVVEMDGKKYLSGAITMPTILSGGVIKELWQDDMGRMVTEMPELPDNPTSELEDEQ